MEWERSHVILFDAPLAVGFHMLLMVPCSGLTEDTHAQVVTGAEVQKWLSQKAPRPFLLYFYLGGPIHNALKQQEANCWLQKGPWGGTVDDWSSAGLSLLQFFNQGSWDR